MYNKITNLFIWILCVLRGYWHISVEALSLTTYRVSQTVTSYTRWLSRLSGTRTSYLAIVCQKWLTMKNKYFVVFGPHTIKKIKINVVIKNILSSFQQPVASTITSYHSERRQYHSNTWAEAAHSPTHICTWWQKQSLWKIRP